MAQNPAPLYFGQPTTGETTLYTVPPNTATDLKEIWVCNTSASPATLTFSIVLTGGAAGPANRLMVAVPFQGNSVQVFAIWEPMLAGSFISGSQGTAGALTVRFSGVEWS